VKAIANSEAAMANPATRSREGRTVLATNPSSVKQRRTVTNEDVHGPAKTISRAEIRTAGLGLSRPM
jgi:hypothetical protein